MKPSGNGRGNFRRVIVSAAIRKEIEQCHDQAVQDGWDSEFISTLEVINFRLRNDASSIGEPLFRLPGLKLLVCHAVLKRVAVAFGIHEQFPLVFLKGISVLKRHAE